MKKFFRKWLDIAVNYFTKRDGLNYVVPTSSPHDFNSDHALGLLMNKQREAFLKVRASGKSCLDNYTAPEKFVEDRIDVYWRQQKIIPPTEEKRRPVRAVTEIRAGFERKKTAR